MKSKASGLLNKVISALTSMARAKTLALKSKTRALKARLIIFSLLRNKKFLASTISHKLHNVLTSHHHHHDNKLKYSHDGDCDEGGSNDAEEDRVVVLYNRDSMAHHRVQDPTDTEPVKDDNLNYGYDGTGYEDEDDKYPDLRHSMFESEEDVEDLLAGLEDRGGSVIDLVKNSKEEAGEAFSLEDVIDQVADLFIKRFHREMRIQKQHSFKDF
ncbi:hypothetical protein SAY87_024670 [Trapa incisa]|uniref:Uncharacterized protein n=1 Tax=Trapa incisa TaxID=236973 RepID=A0AAN7JFK6_9MYRT|nr:hypothetical protein SAY87_024670 [Trapa incisa]